MAEITFRGKDSSFRLAEKVGQLWRGTDLINLRPKQWQLLRYLAERPGEVVEKSELLDNIWGKGIAIEPRIVDQTLSGLRRWLGDDPNDPRFIKTVSGNGLVFVAEVEPIADGHAPDRSEGQLLTADTAAPEYSDADWVSAAAMAHGRAESELKKIFFEVRSWHSTDPIGSLTDVLYNRQRELRKTYEEGTGARTKIERCVAKLVAEILDREEVELWWRTEQRPDDEPFLVFSEMIKTLHTRHV